MCKACNPAFDDLKNSIFDGEEALQKPSPPKIPGGKRSETEKLTK